MGTKVRDVMSSRPRVASPDTPLTQIAELMASEDVGAIPILEGEQLAGMITDRDIVVRAVAKGKNPQGMPAREVWSRDIVCVQPDQDLDDVLQVMAEHQVRRVPVVDEDKRLIGVISQADIALEAKEKDVGETIAEISKPEEGPRHA
jgi:CBS domain-containing protein